MLWIFREAPPNGYSVGPLGRLTVTATSADDGCGWWVVGVVVLAAESVARASGVPRESESDVCVDADGDADVSVAEEFLDHDEVDALFQ